VRARGRVSGQWLREGVLLLGLLATASLPAGCGGGSRAAAPASDAGRAAGVAYGELASAHNARASRLGRLWARAAVQLKYTDREGVARREQGEGHLQVIQPSRLALSVGKLGEVLFWLGSDERMFWWFELGESSRASVALHENATRACAGELALPVHPLDLLDLLGVTALPSSSPSGVKVDGAGRLVVDVPARLGARRVFFDPGTRRPVRVELWRAGDRSPVIRAELSEYERVDVPGEGGVDPRAASRVRVRHLESGSEMVLFLSDMTDGSRSGRLEPIAFDFGGLLDAHAPGEVVVLDEACPTSATRSAIGARRR